MEVKVGDVVTMKKKHPCGSYQWQIVRLGADTGIRCLKCDRHVLLAKREFERRLKARVTPLG